MNLQYLAVLVFYFQISLSFEDLLSKIKIKDKWFVDEHNRVVLFHGINAVQKDFPWIPNSKVVDMTNQTQLLNLKNWGFNSVRLGVMWSGLMPQKNTINQTYLNEIVKIVDNLAKHGMYVLIDLHQDMLSSKFNSYDGVPLWLLDEMPNSKFNFPWPLKNQTIQASVFAAYITESCGHAFQCLYDNKNNFADYFQQYWSIIAKTFANNSAILGYELINEPWAGDVYSNPLLFLPGVAGKTNLMKLYDKVYEEIREYDKDTLVFYEPVTWGVMLNQNYFGTGFSRPPGNDTSKTVLSWHYYCWILHFKMNPLINGTIPNLDRAICDHVKLKISFEAIKLDMIQLGGGPSFLTEFGVCAFPIADTFPVRYNTDECRAILDTTDKYLQSWAYWDSRFYEENLELIPEIVDTFSRVYPKKTNGIPISLNFNSTSKEFIYVYKLNVQSLVQAKLPTEIHIPPNIYPLGFDLRISSFLNWSYNKENNLVLVYLTEHISKDFLKYKSKMLNQIAEISIFSIIDLN